MNRLYTFLPFYTNTDFIRAKGPDAYTQTRGILMESNGTLPPFQVQDFAATEMYMHECLPTGKLTGRVEQVQEQVDPWKVENYTTPSGTHDYTISLSGQVRTPYNFFILELKNSSDDSVYSELIEVI